MTHTVTGIIGGLLLVPAAGFAHDFKAGDLHIGHPWTRATPAGVSMAVGYLSVKNTGKTADVLESATIGGEDAMLHATRTTNGVAEMVMVEDGVAIPAGETVTLAPGGLHLMWDVAAPLKEGAMVDGALVFRNAKTVKVQYKVEPAGARAPEHMH